MKYGKGRIGEGEAGNGRAGNGFLPDIRSADGCINCRLTGPRWNTANATGYKNTRTFERAAVCKSTSCIQAYVVARNTQKYHK